MRILVDFSTQEKVRVGREEQKASVDLLTSTQMTESMRSVAVRRATNTAPDILA